jgi:hypothetical protein
LGAKLPQKIGGRKNPKMKVCQMHKSKHHCYFRLFWYCISSETYVYTASWAKNIFFLSSKRS